MSNEAPLAAVHKSISESFTSYIDMHYGPTQVELINQQGDNGFARVAAQLRMAFAAGVATGAAHVQAIGDMVKDAGGQMLDEARETYIALAKATESEPTTEASQEPTAEPAPTINLIV